MKTKAGAMLSENKIREIKGESPAYGEEAFMRLAEETRGMFRDAQGYDTP